MTIEQQRHRLMCEKLMQLIQVGSITNPWAKKFVLSIYQQLETKKKLSPAQVEKLYSMFDNY